MTQITEVDLPATEHSNFTATPLAVDSLAGGMLLLLAMTAAQRLIGIGRNILFCRLLSPAELGVWNLSFNMLLLGAPLLVLGLPGSFGRYVEFFRQRGQLTHFLRRTSWATAGLAIAGILIMCMLSPGMAWIVYGDTDHNSLLRLVAVSLVAVVTFNFLVELCTALRQVRLVARMQMLNSFLFAMVAVGLIISTNLRSAAVVLAYAFACIVSSIFALRGLKGVWDTAEIAPPMAQRPFWNKLLPFALWIWLANFLFNLFSAADRTMIVHFAGLAPDSAAQLLGQYYSSRVMGDLLIAVASMLGSAMLPYLSHDWETGRRRLVGWRVNLTLKIASICLLLCGTMALAASPWIFHHALAGKYTDGLTVMPGTMVACMWFGLVVISQNYLLCAERARLTSLAIFAGLLTNIGVNYFLLVPYGLWGAVVATSSANAVTLCLLIVFSCRCGLRISGSTVLMMMSPLLLAFGVLPVVAFLITTLCFGWQRNWLFTARETRELTRWVKLRLGMIRKSGQGFRSLVFGFR